MPNNKIFPIVPKEFNDKLVEDGWHVIQETPSINESDIFNPTKEEIILSLVDDLIDAGIDEDAHYRAWNCDKLEASDIREFISDIDKMDSLMQNLRQVVIDHLKQVAECYERNKS